MRRGWLLLALALGACGDGRGESTLTVFAASSLTEAFTELAQTFESSHRGIRVTPTFGGSQVLRVQIEEGAPADVFASANRRHMEALEAAGEVEAPVVFAQNELVLVVPSGSEIRSLDELPRAQRLVIGTEECPAGRYARALMARGARHYGPAWAAAVHRQIVSEESNVRLVRAKVELGEADAAFVYRSDAAGGDLRVITPPAEVAVSAEYEVAVLSRSVRAELAEGFLAHLLGASGRDVLRRHQLGLAR